MTTFKYSGHRRAIVRRTALTLVVAGAGYAAVAFLHDTTSRPNESVAFAPRARAAELNRHASPPAISADRPNIVPSAVTIHSGPSDSARIQDPRECDVKKGIETACMFMD